MFGALAACAVLVTAGQTPLVLIASPGWTAELEEDLRLGLEALPPAARAFPGGPLEIELHPEPAAFGLGDAARPSFTGGLKRLHLYGFEADDDRRALWRLERLSPDAQRRLWRRRAIVHAVVRRWDDRLRWSARPGWEQLMGWEAGRPLIAYPWAFSRKQGMESAALDLATFAEELLVPAESISADAVALDDRVRCRELSKSRFLDGRLAGLEPSWQPERRCPSFDGWADPEHVSGFEIGFAAPSTSGAQSLFGHVFLTIVRTNEESIEDRQVLQLAALISPLESRGLSYLARGLTGGYYGVFVLTGMADVLHEALELEQRSIRRFRLELSPMQRLRLLERIWELERVGYVDYRFLKANCASMLRFLLAPALGDGAPGPPMTPWETPTQVLEALGPTLAVAQLDEATGERARRVGSERRALVKEASDVARAALGDVWPTVERLDVAPSRDRAMAYAALGSSSLPATPWRARLLLTSLRIERHVLDRASVARIRAERATVLPGWKGPTTGALIEARQQRYERDVSPRRRASDALGEMIALDALLRSAPRRAFEAVELNAIAAETEARETFDAAAAAIAALPQDALDAALEEERSKVDEAQQRAALRVVPEAGYGYAYAGVGLSSSRAPLLRLQVALLREELGDQRERGFGGRSEVHLLEAALDLAGASVHRGSLLVVGGRGLSDSGWGWGGRLDYGFAANAHDVAAELERLWVFAGNERLTNFLLASAGMRLGVRVDPSVSAAFHPRLGLAARVQLPGSFGNALRLDAGYTPRLLVGSSVRFEHGVTARAQLTVRIGAVVGFAVSARAEVEAEWRPGSPLAAVGVVGLGVD